MDRKAITLHDLRAKVDARKREIQAKYLHYLDTHVPIQRYAGLVATLLMSRCDSMLLYRHLPQTSLLARSDSENRLRDVLLTAALTTLEIGATLDTLPSLSSWAWYSTTYQQYHAVLLLLTELYRTPDLTRKDRMMTIIDHIFGHCYGVGVRERCSDLLWTVKENLEAFYVMKGVNKRKHHPQQHPTLQPLQGHARPQVQSHPSSASTQDFKYNSSLPPLPTPLDNLNVDFDALLGGLSAGVNAEEFEHFFAGLPSSNDPGAIFVPVDPGTQQGGPEWSDGSVGGATSPNNSLQQWVRKLSTLLCSNPQFRIPTSSKSKVKHILIDYTGQLELPVTESELRSLGV